MCDRKPLSGASIPLDDVVIAWTPGDMPGGPLIDAFCVTRGDSYLRIPQRYQMTWGGCNADILGAGTVVKLRGLLHHFTMITVAHGISPKEAERAFANVAEYRDVAGI